MKTASYGDFSESLHDLAAAAEGRAPIEGMIELTRLCSVKCVHCYIGDARWQKDPAEMTTAEIKDLLAALEACGTLWLCFTGGEAMARPDFRELWRDAKARGFIMTLFSNATLIDASMGEFLHTYPPFNLEISIYGASEQTYEAVTMARGSYRRFRRGIDVVRASGLNWRLKTVLIKQNAHELAAMQALAEEWGVPFKYDGNINPSIGSGESGGKAPCSSRMEPGELARREVADPARLADTEAVRVRSPVTGRSPLLFACGAGHRSFYINARGLLQMCLLTGHRGHDLRSGDSIGAEFRRGWERFAAVREIKRRQDSPCLSCDLAAICENCAGWAYLETGDESSVVAWLCRSAHAKAAAMRLPHRCGPGHFAAVPPAPSANVPEVNHHERIPVPPQTAAPAVSET